MAVGKSVTLGLFAAWLAHDLRSGSPLGRGRGAMPDPIGPGTVDEAEVASHGGLRC